MDAKHNRIIEDFGRHLMMHVRDETCSVLQRIISNKMKDPRSEALHRQYATLSPEAAEILQRFLIVAVDASIARFLNYLDTRPEQLLVGTGSEAIDLKAISDGLVGELYSERGWIAKFSRFVDRVVPLPDESR